MNRHLSWTLSLSIASTIRGLSACGTSGGDSAGSGGPFGGTNAGGTSAGGTSGGGNTGGTTTGGTSAGGSLINVDGGGGTQVTVDGSCGATEVVGERAAANMLFVVDRSGSMNCNLPPVMTTAQCEQFPQQQDMTQPTKWEETRVALSTAIDTLELEGDVSLGMTMFPIAASSCQVKSNPDINVQLLDTTHNSSIDAFLSTVDPNGATPLAGATILSYAYLHSQGQAGTFDGNRFVVLLTDGFETCKPDELPKLLTQDVPNAAKVGIRTFVIGVPGSEDARALLSQVAWAGGTASDPLCTHDAMPGNVGDCHFDLTTTTDLAGDLQKALDAISGTVLTCEFDVPKGTPQQPVDLNLVNVQVNGNEIVKDDDDCATDSDGWQFNSDKSKITLCGSACAEAKMDNSEVKILLGCETKVE